MPRESQPKVEQSRPDIVPRAFLGLGLFLAYPFAVAQDSNPASYSNIVSGVVTVVNEDGIELDDRSNVVVFIDGVTPQALSEPKVSVMSQRGQRFSPRVLPLVTGTSVEFLNDDNIFHNVFSLSTAKTFDLGIYPKDSSRFVNFDQAGLVRVYCNIHPEMVSTVLVLNNDLFDATEIDGSFEIRNVPDGEIAIRVWSEFGDEILRRVVVGGGERLEESFVVREAARVTNHNNKFGRPYREKY